MDSEERLSIERRMGHLEVSFSSHSACVAVLALCGTLLYTAYISPLEDRMAAMKETTDENRAYIKTTGDYAAESRRVLDEWIRENSTRTQP